MQVVVIKGPMFERTIRDARAAFGRRIVELYQTDGERGREEARRRREVAGGE